MTQSPSHYNIIRSLLPSQPLLPLLPLFSPGPLIPQLSCAPHSGAPFRRRRSSAARLVPRLEPTSSMPRSKRPRLATVSVVSVRDTRSFSRRRGDESGSLVCSVCVRCPSFRVRASHGSSLTTARVNCVAFTFRFPYFSSHRPGAASRRCVAYMADAYVFVRSFRFANRTAVFVCVASKCPLTSFAGATTIECA